MDQLARVNELVRGGKFLVTGGSGFFGDYFIGFLLKLGASVVNIDVVPSERRHVSLESQVVDLRDRERLDTVFRQNGPFKGVFHFAAMLAHGNIKAEEVLSSNVDGTRNLLECCKQYGVGQLVFTSTNCLWGEPIPHAITEEEPAQPCEIYGRSKLEAERILLNEPAVRSAIIRTPTIIQAGRLGLLAILFEFIDDGRKVWVVGDGSNRYQFIAAHDLATACALSLATENSEIINVGSSDVPMLRETYEYVIRAAGSTSRVVSIPRGLVVPLMKVAHYLKISPLGPYHWRMISESFRFDTAKAQRLLGWTPTQGNNEILLEAYQYYRDHKEDIFSRGNVSAHRKATPMGAIRLLKWLS